MSHIELSERELEILIHLLTETITKREDKLEDFTYPDDEIILLEKLETLLKISEFKSNGEIKNFQKNKYLN